jgi:hypothetical protein
LRFGAGRSPTTLGGRPFIAAAARFASEVADPTTRFNPPVTQSVLPTSEEWVKDVSADLYAGTVVSRGKIVPVISSEVQGPLGLMHLPRLWLKALLHATNSLAEDWGCGPGGLDKRIQDFVGIDPEAFVPGLLQKFPTYPECEAWVRAHARSLDDESIARSNAFLSTHGLPRGLGPKFRVYLGIGDECVDVGIRLNNFDDWMAIHGYVARYGNAGGPIVPAISSRTTGLLGVAFLPRDWLIALLRAAQLLPPGYRYVDDRRADAVLEQIGVDPAAARAFIAAERPTYLQYEAWLRERSLIDAAVAERVSAGLNADAASEIETYDWNLLHQTLGERRASVTMPHTAGIFAFSTEVSR